MHSYLPRTLAAVAAACGLAIQIPANACAAPPVNELLFAPAGAFERSDVVLHGEVVSAEMLGRYAQLARVRVIETWKGSEVLTNTFKDPENIVLLSSFTSMCSTGFSPQVRYYIFASMRDGLLLATANASEHAAAASPLRKGLDELKSGRRCSWTSTPCASED